METTNVMAYWTRVEYRAKIARSDVRAVEADARRLAEQPR
jgi:hypothetical protein